MLLTIDIGNSNIVWGLVEEGCDIIKTWRSQTHNNQNIDEYKRWLEKDIGLNLAEVNAIIIASVVPAKNAEIKEVCKYCFNLLPKFVGDADIKLTGLDLINNPDEVGADLICNVIGAYNEYGGDLIVIDFGTATTFDVIDDKGNFIGSSFVAGVNILLESLYQKTALLPKVDIAKPDRVIGRNTVEVMQSGIFWGYISLVEGMVDKITKEYGKPLRVIATGGLARLLAQETDVFQTIDDNITLKGLYKIYTDNH